MSDWAKQSETKEYLNAVKATKLIEPPAVGFINSKDAKTTFELQRLLLKQNNTLISLIIDLSSQVQRLQEQISQLKKNIIEIPTQIFTKELELSVDELTKRLTTLNLGSEPIVPKKKGSILIFRNPTDILQQEKKK